MPINSFLYPGAKVTTGYDVDNSLRFDDGSSDYLNKTFSAQNRRTWTYSVWIKRAKLSSTVNLFRWNTNDADRATFQINSSDKLLIQFISGGSFQYNSDATARVFRDTSAWYHLVLAVDTTDATQADRVKLYVNGVQETLSPSTNISQNTDTNVNTGLCQIGADRDTGTPYAYYDGYMAEAVFVDGQQLLPTSFGKFDEDSPTIWKPKDVSGLTFGNNGFHLDFEDSSALGNDVSGNNNDFTVNNLTSIDQTTDTCTNNFATLNPLDFTGSITASEGNTVFQGGRYKATFGVSSGKWYWEAKRLNAPDNAYLGIKADDGDWNNSWNNSYTYYTFNGNYYLNGSSQGSYGSSSTTNDILMFALDMDNGKFYVGENGTFYNSGDPAAGSNPMASSISGTYLPVVINNSSSGTDQYSFNFGNPSFSISSGNNDANGHGNFEYAVPSDYFALCSKNLAEFG